MSSHGGLTAELVIPENLESNYYFVSAYPYNIGTCYDTNDSMPGTPFCGTRVPCNTDTPPSLPTDPLMRPTLLTADRFGTSMRNLRSDGGWRWFDLIGQLCN